jgi:hypothetical protein
VFRFSTEQCMIIETTRVDKVILLFGLTGGRSRVRFNQNHIKEG